ncbi:MAG: PQQ-binding-like beta-propeller repeat protein [Sedimentisphaerales bacterium]|nr:PQQ-binding-like beta-propeller repeat protein [Sedimentisphaerales bacterium]
MFRLFKYSLIFTALLLVFTRSNDSFAGTDISMNLVSPGLLEAANLKLVWESSLPMKKNESMEQMVILGDQIYLISNRNFAMALDRKTGDKIFNRTIALEGLIIEGIIDINDQIIYVVGNRYVELEAKTGNEKKSTEVGYGIESPVVRNNSFFYVSGTDRRLHVLKAEERVEFFKVASENDAMITTVVPGEDYIIFGTDKGDLYSMLPDSPKSLWKFNAADGLVGQVVRDGNDLYFSSKDMNVYKIDASNMYSYKFVWKTLVPGIIQKGPRVTRNMVYQNAFSKNMSVSAMDKDTGRIIWEVAGGVELLAESRGRAYIITEDNTLVVMHNASAKNVYSANFADVTRYACNTMDSKIYIGDKAGRIACLEPLN